MSARERYDLDRKVYGAYDENLQSALKNQAIGRSMPQLELDYMRLETTQTSIDSLMSLGNYYVAYYRLLNMMGLRTLDARSTDELVEELNDANVRVRADIAKARREFNEQKAAAMKEALAYQKQLDAQKAAEILTARRAKVNAQIDKLIESEAVNSLTK